MTSVALGSTPPSRWLPLAWVAAACLFTLLLYRDTALHMASLWSDSETFAHGYVVPLISAWLVWRRRADLARLAESAAPAASALLVIAAAALAWLVGEAANVNALRHFALVGMLVFIVPAIVGWPIARALTFPLGFLFFAVPFGDFLLPVLMRYTADFTVLALRATGVPVYRDGLQIVIPSGTWSVVEACSGVRYLIASLMVGALFAHLHYRSTKRRLLFMLVALAVPIVANWVRAYAIVMIGHLSDNRLAVGVDHLIYGWAFFGVVIGLMFLVGARWSEPDEHAKAALPPPAPSAAPASGWQRAVVAGAAALLLATPAAVMQRADAAVLVSTPKLSLPATLSSADVELPAWEPSYSGHAVTVQRRLAVDGQPAGLYVAYYRHQDARSKMLSSVNVLARADGPWQTISAGTRDVATPGQTLQVHRVTLRRRAMLADQPGLVVWRTYWVDGRLEPDPLRARLLAAWQRLAGRGDDAAVLLFYTVEGAAADATLEALLKPQLVPLQAQLRLTRDGD